MKIINLDNVSAYDILVELEMHGYQAFVIGGYIRNILMSRMPHDCDICTNAPIEKVVEFFKDKRIYDMLYDVIETGIDHGTVTIIGNSAINNIVCDPVEVTTFHDGTTLLDDVRHRDFVINTIACDRDGTIIDLLNGVQDIEDKIIRCVGDPNERFIEDPLRILRAIRFAAETGFTISSSTKEAMHKHKDLLKDIAAERIQVELSKIILENCEDLLLEFKDIISTVIPEFSKCIGFDQKNPNHAYDIYTHIIKSMNAYKGKDLIIKLALFLHDIGKPNKFSIDETGRGHFYGHAFEGRLIADEILHRLKFSNDIIENIINLIHCHDEFIDPSKKVIRKLISKLGEENTRRLFEIRRGDIIGHKPSAYEKRKDKEEMIQAMFNEIIAYENCFKVTDLNINGNDIIGLGVEPGKRIGEILNKLLDKVLEGTIENDHEILMTEAGNLIKLYEIRDNLSEVCRNHTYTWDNKPTEPIKVTVLEIKLKKDNLNE